jgi:hypothetical protein
MQLPGDGDAPPAFVPGIIKVDIHGLEDFADLLRDELEANFSPAVSRIISDHSAGACFGRNNVSLDMKAARERYELCLQRAMDNLTTYISASQTLIEAARKIAANYRSADELSAAKSAAVEDALRQTVLEANARARAADERAALERQIERLRQIGVDHEG